MGKRDSLSTEARELVDLIAGYARQETIDPIKGLGKTVAFGVAGAVLVGLGSVFLALAALRAMQTETEVFEDNLSWLPYFILFALLGLGAIVTWKTLGPGEKESDS